MVLGVLIHAQVPDCLTLFYLIVLAYATFSSRVCPPPCSILSFPIPNLDLDPSTIRSVLWDYNDFCYSVTVLLQSNFTPS